jgi:hypothetical protein
MERVAVCSDLQKEWTVSLAAGRLKMCSPMRTQRLTSGIPSYGIQYRFGQIGNGSAVLHVWFD